MDAKVSEWPYYHHLLPAERDVFHFLVRDYGFVRTLTMSHVLETQVEYVKDRVAFNVMLEPGSFSLVLYALQRPGQSLHSCRTLIDLDSLARVCSYHESDAIASSETAIPAHDPRKVFLKYVDILVHCAKDALEGNSGELRALIGKHREAVKQQREEHREMMRRERTLGSELE